jgi:ribosomal protein L11 methyltransferase
MVSGFLGRRSPSGEGGNRLGHRSPEGEGGADLFQAALIDYSVAALDEPSDDSLRAYFHDEAERNRALTELRQAFPELELTAVDVPDEDWAARSQANLTAIQVGNIVVAPPWDAEQARLKPGTTTVTIQPSMGFGTGHHATTRLCLAALQRANVPGRSVIDVGTGSGVLAIAASLLGASPVIAVDDDPDAIQSARENLELNPDARVDVRIGDLRTSTLGIADVVLANLTGTLLVQAAPQLQGLVSSRGRLIVSGLLADEEPAVSGAFPDLAVLDRSQEDEWVCLVLSRRQIFE